MARYPKGHREQTRTHIVASASHTLRAAGIDGVAIPTLMKEVGLTHGGFYAHFASKDALIAEACATGMSEVAAKLLAIGEAAPPGTGLQAMLDWYLRAEHRDDPATGCVLPTLAGEIARESAAVRHPFTGALATFLEQLAAFVPDDSAQRRTEGALVVMAGMAGAILLARAVDDAALSDRILTASHDFYMRSFATDAQSAVSATNLLGPDTQLTSSTPIAPSSGEL